MHRIPALHRPLLALTLLLVCTGLRAQDELFVNLNHPWNPADPLPRFIHANAVDLSYLESITYFRSGAGHDFADDYEAAGRSMKNYLNVLPAYIGTYAIVPVYSPVNGTLAGIVAEQSEISPGVPRGYQLHLSPTGYDAFGVRLFHINVDPSLQAGDTITAGQLLGYAELRPASPNIDIAVEVVWDLAPAPEITADRPVEFQNIGLKLLSPFDLMDDSTFSTYAAYGLTDRSQMSITKEYRDANPATFTGPLSSVDYYTLSVVAVPEPAHYATLAGTLGLLAVGVLRRRRG